LNEIHEWLKSQSLLDGLKTFEFGEGAISVFNRSHTKIGILYAPMKYASKLFAATFKLLTVESITIFTKKLCIWLFNPSKASSNFQSQNPPNLPPKTLFMVQRLFLVHFV
jgi:hypothetical protein